MSISSSGLFNDAKLCEGLYFLRTSFNRHLGIPFFQFWWLAKLVDISAEDCANSAFLGAPIVLKLDFAVFVCHVKTQQC